MKKKSVLMLYRKEFDVDPVPYRQSKALLENGSNVKIIAWDRSGSHPYKENIEGIEICNVKIKCPYGKAFHLLLKLPFFYWNVLCKSKRKEFDILHCHDIHTLPIGIIVAKFRKKPILYDVHDFYFDSFPKMLKVLLQKFEKFLASKVDYILVPSPPFYEYYKKVNKRVEIVFNVPEKNLFKPRRESGKSNAFTISYFGNVRWDKQLIDLIEATKELENVRIFIGGGGIKMEKIRKIADKYKHVTVSGFVPYKELIRRYNETDCVYAVYPSCNQVIKYSIPMKIFEAMACGLPVIANAEGYTGKFVKENRVGICVEDGNIAQIRRAVEILVNDPKLAKELGENGRKLVESFYNWENMKKSLLNIYKDMVQ
ncbi:MAG TPA: glycosyltransferase WbuB [Thermoplasmatales archaeon]|nr:glycosyltransferase WbuB [Thermoplasmatales archaeon]